MSNKKGNVLVVDDDEDVLFTAKVILRPHYNITVEKSPKRLEKAIKDNEPDVVILDMNFKTGATTGNEGLYWLRKIKEMSPEIEVLMNTAYGDIQLAVTCMKEGATDFLVKPWEKEKLLSTVNTVFQMSQSKKEIRQLKETQRVLSNDLTGGMEEIIGSSPQMKEVFETISQVASTEASILILGENGTGKELVARAIHKLSERKDSPFIKVDVGALSGTLFESELFGHKKGAFTDAKEDRIGRFEMANKGTIFLDEIGNISEEQQVKLLSVLQNRQLSRIGENKLIDIDIRLITATNAKIDTLVAQNKFRQDLLFRINTIEIVLPPLRDRDGDIELLVQHFLKIYAKRYNKPNLKVDSKTLQKLNDYNWPGNVRELMHATERAVILCKNDVIQPDDFLIKDNISRIADSIDSLNVENVEKTTIERAIQKHKGNLTKAANELGMGRSTLYRKMKKYKI